jgi:hypothetical protein
MAGFCDFVTGLQAPNLVTLAAKLPTVSGGRLKYSRFWETRAGDRVRSAAWRAREYGVTKYRYTVVNDRTVLVDPGTHRIVQVIE